MFIHQNSPGRGKPSKNANANGRMSTCAWRAIPNIRKKKIHIENAGYVHISNGGIEEIRLKRITVKLWQLLEESGTKKEEKI
jgi:hypothetical protein